MGYEDKTESIKMLIREGAWAAKECHKILFDDRQGTESKLNELIAAVHLNKAVSFMAAAKSLYISNYESLEHTEVERIFDKFQLLESEFFQNLRTDHSHQWTDQQFQEFKEVYEPLFEEL